MHTLREFIGDLTRSATAVVDSLDQDFGPLERVGGSARVYAIGGTNQHGAIYTSGYTGSAIAVGWVERDVVKTIYWWDIFNFGEPDYAIDLPDGIDFEKILPALKKAITSKQMGEIII